MCSSIFKLTDIKTIIAKIMIVCRAHNKKLSNLCLVNSFSILSKTHYTLLVTKSIMFVLIIICNIKISILNYQYNKLFKL